MDVCIGLGRGEGDGSTSGVVVGRWSLRLRWSASVTGVNMWRRVLWQASTLLLVAGTLDFRFFNQRRQYAPPSPAPQMNCFEYTVPVVTDRLGRALDKGWRPQNTMARAQTATFPVQRRRSALASPRVDGLLLPDGHDIVKEHAKLVQDINSLRQYVFVAPLADDHKDYDESIFHEIIETTSTTSPRPTTTKPIKTTRQTVRPNSIPVILVGGASQRLVGKMPQLKLAKPTEFRPVINLVGTSASPLLKHPYPFVMQPTNQKPIKVCMTSVPVPMPMPTAMFAPTTTRRPPLWMRILSSLIPRW